MAELRSHVNTEKLVYYHNVLGLEDDTSVDANKPHEMRQINACFAEWEETVRKRLEEKAIKYVRGDLTEKQFKALLHKFRTVEETRKQIPHLPSEREHQILLREILNSILAKLDELRVTAENLRLFKSAYQKTRQRLLKILFGCFGTAEDIGFGDYLEISNFDYAIMKLEEMDMIPKGLKEEIKTYLCPVGRWL